MRLSVGLKLYAGFGLVLAALVVTGVFAITQLASVGEKGKSIYDDGLEQTQKAATLRRDMLLMRASILGYVAAPADKRAEFGTKIAELQTGIEEDLAALRAEPNLTEAQATNLDTVEQNLADWYAARDAGPIAKTDAGDFEGARDAALFGKGGAMFQALLDAVGEFSTATNEASKASYDSAESTQSGAIADDRHRGRGTAAAGIAFFSRAASRLEGGREPVGEPRTARSRASTRQGHRARRPHVGAHATTTKIDSTPATRSTGCGVVKCHHEDTPTMDSQQHPPASRPAAGHSQQVDELVTAKNELGQGGTGRAGDPAIATTTNQVAEGTGQTSRSVQDVSASMSQLGTAIERVTAGTQSTATSVKEVDQAINQLGSAIEQIVQGSQQQMVSVDSANKVGTKVAQAADDMSSTAASAAGEAREAAEVAQTAPSRALRRWYAAHQGHRR
jgi:hypothetical protein